MPERKEHSYIARLKGELSEGRISRREFLRIATLLGVSAPAAYGLLGLVDPGRAFGQAALPKGGRVRVGMRVHEIKDPHTISWVEASNTLRQNCDYLTRTGNDNVTRPWLLERWEASPDLKTWTLRLRKDVKWSNGKQFTADDVVWNIKRVVEPATGSSVLGLMKGFLLEEYETEELDKDGKKKKSTRLWDSRAIEKVDAYTVRLNGNAAQLAVPENFFHYPFLMLYPEDNGAFKVGMVGTGAFTIESYEVGRRAVMRARKDYWGRGPYLDTLEFIDLGSDPSPYIAALASKQVDGLFEVDFGQLDAIKALSHVEIYSVTTAQTAVARGKYNEKPFSDKRVRMALKLATDPQQVLDIVMRGAGSVAEHHHVAPVHPEYAKMPPLKRDVTRAKQLLTMEHSPPLAWIKFFGYPSS